MKLQQLKVNLETIEFAARIYPFGYRDKDKYYVDAMDGLGYESKQLIKDLNGLRSDYTKIAKDGFEARLKAVVDRAAELSKRE